MRQKLSHWRFAQESTCRSLVANKTLDLPAEIRDLKGCRYARREGGVLLLLGVDLVIVRRAGTELPFEAIGKMRRAAEPYFQGYF
jgi:hypothetical protein